VNPCPHHGPTGPILAIMHCLEIEIPAVFGWSSELVATAAEYHSCPMCLQAARRTECFSHIQSRVTVNGIQITWKDCHGGVMAVGTLMPDPVDGVRLVEGNLETSPATRSAPQPAAAPA